jgi:uncharacterized protein YbjT (DUF2867 family)
MSPSRTVLVTGATGRTGRHVVAGLRSAGVGVRALTRSPDQTEADDGVTPTVGDLTRPETLTAAAEGVDAIFLLWPSFSSDQAEESIAALCDSEPHVVYLSAAALQGPPGRPMQGVWSEVESLVERATSRWTFVRGGGFATNTLQWADQIRAGDVVRLPFPEAGRSVVHERDIADVAVAALTNPAHVGRSYAVTGPEVLTQTEQVRQIGDAIGRTLRVEPEPLEETRTWMTEGFGDPAVVETSIAHWSSLVDTPERVSDDVVRVTGNPARTFRQWADDHAGDFR